jgi:hypothetical protein
MILDKLIFIFGYFLIFVKRSSVAADVTHGHAISMPMESQNVQSLENSVDSFLLRNMQHMQSFTLDVRYRGQTRTWSTKLVNNNYIYIFRNIKTPNYVLFLLCVCLIFQSWMFVLLMMPHVGYKDYLFGYCPEL